MYSLNDLLTATDQQMARQMLSSNGLVLGATDAARAMPVDAKTLVVMTPADADFFAASYLRALGDCQPARWAVLWQHVYEIPGGEEIAPEVHRFQSSEAPVDKAVILCSMATSAAQVRGMLWFAVDQGILLENCRVECPWMAEAVTEDLQIFLDADRILDGVVTVEDDQLRGVNLNRLLNLPDQGLSYLPAVVQNQL